MPNLRTNWRILGAAEGTYYGSKDDRYKAGFASAKSGLSFGAVQFDVKANKDAQRIFRDILTRATGTGPGQISAAQAASFYKGPPQRMPAPCSRRARRRRSTSCSPRAMQKD
jgi:hypothetical protein